MNRVEFMAELERLLADLPEDERQAAVKYYADYFADAGAENEAEVIRELGSPEKTAESIKADYYGRTFDESRFEHKDYMEKYGQQASGQQTFGQQSAGPAGASVEGKKPWTSRGLKILLIVLIAIVVWPLSLGLICAVLGILAAVVCLFAGLVIAAVCVMIAGGVRTINECGISAGGSDDDGDRPPALCAGAHCHRGNRETLYDRISGHAPWICGAVQAADPWKGGVENEEKVENILDRVRCAGGGRTASYSGGGGAWRTERS